MEATTQLDSDGARGVIARFGRPNLLHECAAQTGVPWHEVYRELRQAGALSLEMRLASPSKNEQMGAFYESEFRRLVPSAVSQNDLQHQARVDFLVGASKVEIKSSSLYAHAGGTLHWKFRVYSRSTGTHAANFYVCFGRNDAEDMNNYSLFLFPAEILTTKHITVRPDGGNYWSQFTISPDDLAGFFDKLAEGE